MCLLGNLLCKNRLMKLAGLLTLLLITRTAWTTPLHVLELQRGFGNAGDLVFKLVGGAHTTCTMNGVHENLNFWLYNSTVCSGNTSGDHWDMELSNGSITLTAGNTYHITPASLQNYYLNNCSGQPFTSQPIFIQQFYCDDGMGFYAASITPSNWSVTCTNSGVCTTSSGAITVTLP